MSMSSPPAALTSLLNSLYAHLHSQTQLLPGLHTQLGLSPTALEEDLKLLQQQLIESVERQIGQRNAEVEQWMERCAGIERECLKYSAALGGNIKDTGNSVGELRKETNLPRRCDRVSAYQDTLRQLYHTKHEQLTTLSSRLNSLAQTLGDDFFARDIIEATVAPGASPSDPHAYRDVTPERFLKLEKELVRGKAEVSKRLKQLSCTFEEIDFLYTELGMVPPVPDDVPSPFHDCASTSTSQLSSSTNSHSDPFVMSTPTPDTRHQKVTPLLFKSTSSSPSDSDYQRIFAKYVARVEEVGDVAPKENQHVHIGLEGVDPSPKLVSWANNLRASMEDIKRRREAHIQAMYDELEGLWRRLGVGEADIDAFVEANRGSTEDTVREYEEELERMLELKRERMGAFIESARQELVRLWDDLMVGDEERGDFAPFVDDEFTEELLSIHEGEIRCLKEERRLKAPLLAGIKKYFEICEEEKELAAAASDQTRLLGRGPRDPGRLLREEKMRKRVSKEKPRLEQDLLASIPAWEEETRQPFLVHGVSILQVLVETASAADQENRRKPPRAGSAPARSITPVTNSQPYVPGAKSRAVTPAVRPASADGSQPMPNKRRKVGEPLSNHQESGIHPGYASNKRAPLESYNGENRVCADGLHSTTKRTKTPNAMSSLPRPIPSHSTMPAAKTRIQQQSLGHGRMPSAAAIGGGHPCPSVGQQRYMSTSSTWSVSSGKPVKAARAKRESFKPRPSIDSREIGHIPGLAGSRWGRMVTPVTEVDGES